MQSLIQLRKISLALAITQILILPVAQAATIVVNDFGDDSIDDGNCTLREAIVSANTNPGNTDSGCTSGDSGNDTISFTGVGAGQTIVLTQAPALSIDISSEPLTIDGPGTGLLTIDGNKSTRTNAGIFYLSNVTASINDLTIFNGARYQGGGIYAINSATVHLTDTVVSGNMATLGNGGGIFAYGSDVILTNSTVSGNSAIKRWGGGIIANSHSTLTLTNSTVSGNVATWGGGIIANSHSALTLTNSTVSGNSAVDNDGGGIIASSDSSAILSNSTVSGNAANGRGGGISVNNSTLSLINTTVSGNLARIAGAGISVRATDTNTSSASLSNSIVAYSSGSAPEDCNMSVEGTGTTSVTADVHNIIADGSCATSALNVDPTLGPLADNGGPTKTHKLLAGSPAIDAGDNDVCDIAPINSRDQRGFERPLVTNCDIGAFEFKLYSQGLTIIKDVNNNNSGTAVPADFTLHLMGGMLLGSMYDGTEEMKSGDTPDVEAGTPYTLSETALPGYTEMGIACTDDVDGVTPVNHPVNLSASQYVTCTISNDDDAVAPPQLTLIKVVTNNNGGNAAPDDFLPTVDGIVVASGVKNAYFAGVPLVLNETLLPGYVFTSLTGTGCPAALGGTVTLAPADDITCTITNNDVAPQLTLIKTVVNDNGGNAVADDFLPTVDAIVVISGAKNPYMANTPLALNETLLSGYAFTSLTGDLKCPPALGGTVTLAPGDDITCEITNDDIPPTAQLTLVKTVIGGAAAADEFLLTVDGGSVLSGVQNTYSANTPLALNETLLPGYAFTSLTGTKCPAALGGTVTLAPGDDITCTITNTETTPTAQLTLIKTVVNDNGGNALPDAFLPTVDGNVVVSGAKKTYLANTALALDETLLPGYTFTELTGDDECPDVLGGTVTLAPADDITCTITNNDVAPQLTLIKTVENNYGGNAAADAFLPTVAGAVVVSGVKNTYTANTPLALNETLLTGYTFTSLTGNTKCPAALGGTVTLAPGDDITCEITNNDVEPQLTLVKVVNGGTALPNDFLLTVDGGSVLSGEKHPYLANTPLALDETQWPGYVFASLTGDAKCPAVLGGTVTLAPGDDITCTITNSDGDIDDSTYYVIPIPDGGAAVIYL